MLIEIRAKQIQSSKKVENVLVANEFATGLGFGENAVQFVEPALRNHVDVRHYLVALWVSHQVDIQSFGAEQNPGSNFFSHRSASALEESSLAVCVVGRGVVNYTQCAKIGKKDRSIVMASATDTHRGVGSD